MSFFLGEIRDPEGREPFFNGLLSPNRASATPSPNKYVRFSTEPARFPQALTQSEDKSPLAGRGRLQRSPTRAAAYPEPPERSDDVTVGKVAGGDNFGCPRDRR